MDLDPEYFPSAFDVQEKPLMQKFNARFSREFEVQIEAESIEHAQTAARQVGAEIPNCKLLSVIVEGYTEKVDAPSGADLNERRNAQLAVRVRELTDQPEPERAA